jgi:hypothetical protein
MVSMNPSCPSLTGLSRRVVADRRLRVDEPAILAGWQRQRPELEIAGPEPGALLLGNLVAGGIRTPRQELAAIVVLEL